MRLAIALVFLLFTSASGAANDDDRKPGLRVLSDELNQLAGKSGKTTKATKASSKSKGSNNRKVTKSKDPNDPPFEGNSPDILPSPFPGDEAPALEFTLGEASGDYDGELYSDKTDRPPAENVPEYVPEVWEAGDEPSPSEIPNNDEGNGNSDNFEIANGKITDNFEIENGKIRCIVKYKPDKKGELMNALVADIHYEFDDVNTVVISIPANALTGLQHNLNIVAIYPDSNSIEIIDDEEEETEHLLFDRRGRHLAQTNPYGVNMLDVEWLKKKGEGIKVCVLDTGYTPSHSDLPSNVDWAGQGIDTNNPPADTHGHGTHVAGTIVALDNDLGVVGVSPGAGLVVGPFLEQTKYHISDTIDGIRKCRDKGAKVVNMSYGPTAIAKCQGGNFFNQIFHESINGFTVNDNMLLVAAAGNHGACAGANANALGYPASYTNVLSVASVDSDGRRAGFSAKNNQVNIAAPGVDVDSTANNGGYTRMSGTSMASPHVAGIAARVWSIMPWLTALQLRSFLTSAAQYEYQSFTGAGLVNHGFFTIMLQRSGKCLDNWGSTAKLYTCGYGYTDQMFTYDYFNNMIVGSDGKCLRSSGNYNGASVTFSACSKDDSAQKFSYNRSTKQFTNNGGYCFDNHGAYQFQNNGVVHMWSCHSGTNQKWLLGKDYETRLYQDSNMYAGGKMYRTPGAGRWGSMPTAINNDRLTRVMIPRGFAFEYFEHTSYGGWHGIFGSHDNWINLYMGSRNDRVSSFKVHKLPDGKVRLCKHYDCSSQYYNIDMVKKYSSMPSAIGNDQLSRVLIPRGYRFQYFEHGHFRGWSGTFGSCSRSTNLWMGGHNDAVSSFKVTVLTC